MASLLADGVRLRVRMDRCATCGHETPDLGRVVHVHGKLYIRDDERFVRGVVATSADRVGLSYAEYLAAGCYWVLSILTFIAAFNQLGIQFALLEKLILIGSAGLAAGFALAFGPSPGWRPGIAIPKQTTPSIVSSSSIA